MNKYDTTFFLLLIGVVQRDRKGSALITATAADSLDRRCLVDDRVHNYIEAPYKSVERYSIQPHNTGYSINWTFTPVILSNYNHNVQHLSEDLESVFGLPVVYLQSVYFMDCCLHFCSTLAHLLNYAPLGAFLLNFNSNLFFPLTQISPQKQKRQNIQI